MCSTTVVETHFNKFSIRLGAPQKIIRNSLIRVLAAQIQRLRGVPTILYECVAPASLKPVHLQVEYCLKRFYLKSKSPSDYLRQLAKVPDHCLGVAVTIACAHADLKWFGFSVPVLQ